MNAVRVTPAVSGVWAEAEEEVTLLPQAAVAQLMLRHRWQKSSSGWQVVAQHCRWLMLTPMHSEQDPDFPCCYAEGTAAGQGERGEDRPQPHRCRWEEAPPQAGPRPNLQADARRARPIPSAVLPSLIGSVDGTVGRGWHLSLVDHL